MFSVPHSETAAAWLLENGPGQLELLLRAVIYHPSTPLLIADNDRNHRDASYGAAKLLGLSREEVIGRRLDDFVESGFKPQIPELWQGFLQQGRQDGTLRLLGAGGGLREVSYMIRGNVLPVRHVVALREGTPDGSKATGGIPAWVQDYALFLLDTEGKIVAWYGGAERIYGITSFEAVGSPLTLLYPLEDGLSARLRTELKRSIAEGHFGNEAWCVKKDGQRFWANTITMALKDEAGIVMGFARIVRDFTERHERDLELERSRSRRPVPAETLVPGILSGEFDHIPEANDVFLEMVGYTREDLESGRLRWPDLTPPEFFAQDELAHEESLRFGACSPFEKELICKDGTRIPVLVATAVLKLSPFRWISFVQDLRERNQRENVSIQVVEGVKNDFEEIIGRSPPLKRLLELVEVVAPTAATVLILGETGTGKELVARAVHRLSPRRDKAFISLNCAAIPTGLLESELFGYEKGAFTGALSQKIGRFEMAHRGTLFLDEVGDIPLELQPKLLRALQEKSFERLGGTRTIPIDVRLVAATNRDLDQMMGEKTFRSDLYYRLKVFPITTPPLRDHPEDIPALARHFTTKYAGAMGRKIDRIAAKTMAVLVSKRWPGNVREFENYIERSVILSRGAILQLPPDDAKSAPSLLGDANTLDEVERNHIIRILRETNGLVSEAAIRLGRPRTTLNGMMRRLGIDPKRI